MSPRFAPVHPEQHRWPKGNALPPLVQVRVSGHAVFTTRAIELWREVSAAHRFPGGAPFARLYETPDHTVALVPARRAEPDQRDQPLAVPMRPGKVRGLSMDLSPILSRAGIQREFAGGFAAPVWAENDPDLGAIFVLDTSGQIARFKPQPAQPEQQAAAARA